MIAPSPWPKGLATPSGSRPFHMGTDEGISADECPDSPPGTFPVAYTSGMQKSVWHAAPGDTFISAVTEAGNSLARLGRLACAVACSLLEPAIRLPVYGVLIGLSRHVGRIVSLAGRSSAYSG